MEINKTNNVQFGAKIKLIKPDIKTSLLKIGGSASVATGTSSVGVGASSGADMIVHGSNSAVPFMQSSSSLFDVFAQTAHKMLNSLVRNEYQHGAFDASFFSSVTSTAGSGTYAHGMNNIIKAIERNYSKKIPS